MTAPKFPNTVFLEKHKNVTFQGRVGKLPWVMVSVLFGGDNLAT